MSCLKGKTITNDGDQIFITYETCTGDKIKFSMSKYYNDKLLFIITDKEDFIVMKSSFITIQSMHGALSHIIKKTFSIDQKLGEIAFEALQDLVESKILKNMIFNSIKKIVENNRLVIGF